MAVTSASIMFLPFHRAHAQALHEIALEGDEEEDHQNVPLKKGELLEVPIKERAKLDAVR